MHVKLHFLFANFKMHLNEFPILRACPARLYSKYAVIKNSPTSGYFLKKYPKTHKSRRADLN